VQRVYERMVSLGIVEHVGEKHRGLFKSARYPEKDHGPEAALLQKIEAALGGGAQERVQARAEAPGATPDTEVPAAPPGSGAPAAQPDAAPPAATPESKDLVAKAPDPRITALIALLQAAGLFGKLFPGADRTRADELAKDYWPARAVEDELRMIRLAQEEAATL
jgi:hypothetical protein